MRGIDLLSVLFEAALRPGKLLTIAVERGIQRRLLHSQCRWQKRE
jgi:hypothetical protein